MIDVIDVEAMPSLDIIDAYVTEFTNMQVVIASWIGGIEANAYTQPVLADIDVLQVQVVTMQSHMMHATANPEVIFTAADMAAADRIILAYVDLVEVAKRMMAKYSPKVVKRCASDGGDDDNNDDDNDGNQGGGSGIKRGVSSNNLMLVEEVGVLS